MTFIGPKPMDAPEYLTPFDVTNGDTVVDAGGAVVARVNLSSYDHDYAMARAIADALNEKFGAPTKMTMTAEVYVTLGGLGRWLVVEGRAYYRGPDGKIEKSFFTPEGLKTTWSISREGVIEIDPAVLAGVEGTE